MAVTSQDHTKSLSILPALSRLGEAFVAALVRMSQANRYARELDYLSGLSDEQLAAKGIKRSEIVHHVFRGRMFL